MWGVFWAIIGPLVLVVGQMFGMLQFLHHTRDRTWDDREDGPCQLNVLKNIAQFCIFIVLCVVVYSAIIMLVPVLHYLAQVSVRGAQSSFNAALPWATGLTAVVFLFLQGFRKKMTWNANNVDLTAHSIGLGNVLFMTLFVIADIGMLTWMALYCFMPAPSW